MLSVSMSGHRNLPQKKEHTHPGDPRLTGIWERERWEAILC